MPDDAQVYGTGTVNQEMPLEAALEYAHHGFRVFPCRPDKKPLVQWKEAATTDADSIRAWWARWPAAMIGLRTGDGLAVVDLDIDKATGEALGEATAERLGLLPALRSGIQASTPSGGIHAWFSGDLPTTTGRIGPGIDTRGRGGYVIAPGSSNSDGSYVWLTDGMPGRLLPALPDAVSGAVSHVPAAPAPTHPPAWTCDTGTFDVARSDAAEVTEILSGIDPDIGYQGWCSVLMGLHDHFEGSEEGLTIADTWSSRGAKYRPGEVAQKWRSFRSGAGVSFGTVCAMARGNGADLADIARRHRSDENYPQHSSSPASGQRCGADPPMKFLDYAAMRSMPVPEWIVDGVLQQRSAALMFGKSNAFKSFLAIDLALSVATGRSWHGRRTRKGRVLYIATEGGNGVGRIRVPGWYDAHAVPEAERYNAFLWPREVLLDSADSIDKLIRSLNSEIHGQGFSLVLADIFGGTMMGPETKDETARAWVGGVQSLIREAGVSVLTVAHTGWADETRARMHTHFWGSFDTRLKVEGNKEALQTVMSVERHKDADSTGHWGFQMVQGPGPDGLTTLVPELADDVKVEKRRRISGKPKIALEALDDALAQYGTHRRMEGLPTCKVVALSDWRKMCDRHSLSDSDKDDARRQAFGRARSKLQEEDLVRCYAEFAWRASSEQRDNRDKP